MSVTLLAIAGWFAVTLLLVRRLTLSPTRAAWEARADTIFRLQILTVAVAFIVSSLTTYDDTRRVLFLALPALVTAICVFAARHFRHESLEDPDARPDDESGW